MTQTSAPGGGADRLTAEGAAKILWRIRESVGRVLIGQETNTGLLLAALLADGHVLLEDVPGTGKTMLAKALAASLNLKFSRIQFTPDLLPSDVTGLNVYSPKTGEFVMKKGPVFTNILLADELNRAAPRTQSSLLEAMEERQVTIDGETCPLPRPFLVIATQNPVETAGTFPLPEAQLDRFLLRLSMGYPDRDGELAILNRFETGNPLPELAPVCAAAELAALRTAAANVFLHPDLKGYTVDLVRATRAHRGLLCGASPRAALALSRAARALALVRGRDYVVPEDIKDLTVPVLAHRLTPAYSAGGAGTAESVLEEILHTVPLPTENWERRP